MSVLAVVAAMLVVQAEPVEVDSIWFPERREGFVSAAAELRFALPLADPLKFGALLDASATWYAPFPLAVRVRAWPLALFNRGEYPRSPPVWSVAGALEVLADTRFFAVGAGLGFATSRETDPDADPRSVVGLVINPVVRLGALDGVHLIGRSVFRSVPGTGLWLQGLDGTLQVPVVRGWWVRARGSGDASQIALGDAGLRVAVGSGFLSVMAGFTLFQTHFGPSVGVGYEQRLP